MEPHLTRNLWRPAGGPHLMAPWAYLAAFDPFGGRAKNRSWEVARRVNLPEGVALVRLPVDFARLRETITPLLCERPRALLLLGEALTHHVAVEEVALNLIHAEGGDNAGAAPKGEEIVTGAPLALRAGWNAIHVAEEIRKVGVPARPSYHAGTFACNAVLYHALHLTLHQRGRRNTLTSIGFLHLPRSYRGAGTDLSSLVQGVEVGLKVLLTQPRPSSSA